MIAPSRAAEDAVIIPASTADATSRPPTASRPRCIAGGCFWGVQGVFQHTPAWSTRCPAMPAAARRPPTTTWSRTGTTGHAEIVSRSNTIRKKISYGKILQIFFSVAHDPTQLNRQGPGLAARSTARRSSPPTTSRRRSRRPISRPAQRRKGLQEADRDQGRSAGGFFPAEAYHQDYLTLHPNQPYIAYNDIPKVENLKKIFRGKLYQEADAGEQRQGHQLRRARHWSVRDAEQTREVNHA